MRRIFSFFFGSKNQQPARCPTRAAENTASQQGRTNESVIAVLFPNGTENVFRLRTRAMSRRSKEVYEEDIGKILGGDALLRIVFDGTVPPE